MDSNAVLTLNEKLFYGVFALVYFVVPAVLVWMSYSKFFKSVDLSALWTHNRRADKFAVIILGSWWIHSCTLVLWTMSKTVTTADYATYGAIWITPLLVKMFVQRGRRR